MLAPVLALAMMQTQSPPQTQEFNPMVIEQRHINACEGYLNEVEHAKGSVAFRRILFVSEAIAAADRGAKLSQAAAAKFKETKDITSLWEVALESRDIWVDHMQCAAQIMSHYAPMGVAGNDESSVSTLLAVAFNQEAHALEKLNASEKRRLARTNEPTAAEQMADAEEMHSIAVEQGDAADSIRMVTSLAAAEATDTTDVKATRMERLLLTCSEEQQVSRLLNPAALDRSTVFGTSAAEMLKILGKLKCLPQPN